MLNALPYRTLSWVRFLLVASVISLAACDSVEDRVAKHYERGVELIAEGEDVKAILEFRNALKLNRDFVPAHVQMAEIYTRTGDVQGAVGHLKRIVEIDANNVPARTSLARYMMFGDALDEAESQIQAALAVAPSDPELLALSGGLALRRKDVPAAVALANKALEIDPANETAGMVLIGERFQAGDYEQALKIIDKFLETHQGSAPLNLLKLQTLQRIGDDKAVEAHLKRLVEMFPDNTGYRAILARYFESIGDLLGAETQLREIARTEPSNSDAALDVARFIKRTQSAKYARDELVRLVETAEKPAPYELALAQFDHSNGREAEARTLLEDMIARGGEAADVNAARVQLAHFLLIAGEKERAGELVDLVLAEDAKNIKALAVHTSLLISAADYEGAILAVRAGLHEDPTNVALLQLAATAHERNGNPEIAGERLATALTASRYDPEITFRYVRFLRFRGDEDAARTVLQEAVNNRPNDHELITELGMAELRQRNWDGAARSVARLQAIGTADAVTNAERIRAGILGGQQKFTDALDLLRQADAASPDSNEAIGSIVRTFVSSGQTDQAVAYVDSALARNPQNPVALHLRGALHEMAGETAQAEERFKALIATDPGNALGYVSLAGLYLSADRGDEAKNVLRAGLAETPNSAILSMELGKLLEARGEFDEAIEIYGNLHRSQPDSFVAANNYASLIADHRADDPDSLLRAYTAAKRLRNSNIPHFLDTYGWLQYLNGDYNGALRSLLPVASALPDNPWVRYHIGMTYAKLGKPAEARDHLEAALELGGSAAFTKVDEVRATLAELPAP